MAMSLFAKSRPTGPTTPKAKILIEAYQCLLQASEITATFVLGEKVTETKKGVATYSGSFTMKWTGSLTESAATSASTSTSTSTSSATPIAVKQKIVPLSKRSRDMAESLVVDLPNGVLEDFSNSAVHRVKREALHVALIEARQQSIKVHKAPTELVTAAQACFDRFYPNQRKAESCLTHFAARTYDARKIYILVDRTPADAVIERAFRDGTPSKLDKGVTITLTVDDEQVAYPLFVTHREFGTRSKTSESRDRSYTEFCANPFISPSVLYNAILAHAFIVKPVNQQAKDLLDLILSTPRI